MRPRHSRGIRVSKFKPKIVITSLESSISIADPRKRSDGIVNQLAIEFAPLVQQRYEQLIVERRKAAKAEVSQ